MLTGELLYSICCDDVRTDGRRFAPFTEWQRCDDPLDRIDRGRT